ncbi:MAG TPA: alpha-L-arabinofuranosidase C-terminal domain-containing protein, partial [Fimbriimonadaceae bacterium]|nr:alpha-L-arabinofuranosidase C-terminal domain-containing protein [Fimbriimonadaceae bacterium]
SGRFGVINEGFWGIPLRAGARYRLRLWVRTDTPLDAVLEDSSNARRASASFDSTNGRWRMLEATLTASQSEAKARLAILPKSVGTTWIAYASLMPLDTWKGRANGLRRDLAEKIAALRPGFVRFPGGCFIEGHNLAQAYNWKATLGPVEERPPFARIFWGYPSSNGFGFHEYLQWCEDLGSPALFVANCGMSHTETAPMNQMQRYVQDALDAIEYANGPTTSTWGAQRARNGHPKPFNLRYIQIGNENGGPAYDERYALMTRAIKARYPDVQVVANVWGGVPRSMPLEIIDEHYYSNPAFFWRNTRRYDSYDRNGPRIYVGEYAVTRASGEGNLAAALAEAAFMSGMERNADVVRMASYAPLFVNVNNRQWNPNAIVFDSARSYGTPSYWVQWLFANHRPDWVLAHQVQAPQGISRPLTGRVGLQTWRTQAEFRNLEVEIDGRSVLRADQMESRKLEVERGEWSVRDGLISQGSLEENRRALVREVTIRADAKKVVMRLQARKLGGAEGFIVMMGISPDQEFQWNLGGWGNTVHAFQKDGERTGPGVQGRIEQGRWYDIRLEREGDVARGYLDGVLVEEIRDLPTPDFAAVAGLDQRRNEIVLKAVNGSNRERTLRLHVTGAQLAPTAEALVMTGESLSDENSFATPEKIRPRPLRIERVAPEMSLRLPPRSLMVVRFRKR